MGDDLRATSEDLIADAERLMQIEEQKSRLAVDDPAVRRLSAASVDLVRSMVAKTQVQEAIAGEAE